MRGNLEGSAVLWGGKLKVEFGALTRGLPKKDQDCFFVRAPGGSDGLVFGICDGHSLSDNRGQEQAEDAAKHLAFDFWSRVKDKLVANPPDASKALAGSLPPPPAADLGEAATATFLSHQDKCMKFYETEIAAPILEAKKKLEEELDGEELPLELPQEGGTTATAIAVHNAGLLTAWVGDSRAVIATEDADGADGGSVIKSSSGTKLRVTPLTHDHGTYDEVERARLIASGGTTGIDTMSSHVSRGLTCPL